MNYPLYPGCLIVPAEDTDPAGLWFVFHADGDHVLALDLTRPHPDIPWRGFEAALNTPDLTAESEKTVLRGGPVQPDDALTILHETIVDDSQSLRLTDDFSIRTYRYVLLPGRPPVLEGNGPGTPDRIDFARPVRFLAVMGVSAWETDELSEAIGAGRFKSVPATKTIVFDTSHSERLRKARYSLN